MAHVLALTTAVLAAAPEVALICTPGDGEVSEVRFQNPSSELAPAAVRFEHVRGSTVHGALLPGSRTVLAIAQTSNSRDPSWAASLLCLEPGAEPQPLVDRVAVASRPLITPGGRVFVQRGREGPSRVDAITIDEVNPRTGQTRQVHRFDGYTAFLAGSTDSELLLYRVGPTGADLVAVHIDALGVRPLVSPLEPMARDFVTDGRHLTFTSSDANGWLIAKVDVRSGGLEVVARSSHVAALPALFNGALSFNREAADGLRSLSGALWAPARGPGFERAVLVRDGWLVALHERPSDFPFAYATELKSGRFVTYPKPSGMRLDVAGVVE